jgi:hypothetical protein
VPILLLILLAGVLAYLVWRWRTTTLTRACRWRLDRTGGPGHWRCAACGAETDLPDGGTPRDCLKLRGQQ